MNSRRLAPVLAAALLGLLAGCGDRASLVTVVFGSYGSGVEHAHHDAIRQRLATAHPHARPEPRTWNAMPEEGEFCLLIQARSPLEALSVFNDLKRFRRRGRERGWTSVHLGESRFCGARTSRLSYEL